jgi:hypothetical protein
VSVGNWLLPRVGAHLGTGISAFVNAAIGPIVLLLVIRLLTGGLWGGGEGGRFVSRRGGRWGAVCSHSTGAECGVEQWRGVGV